MSEENLARRRLDPRSSLTVEPLERLVRGQLELLGEDAEREGLVRTPARVAAALQFLTRGYEQTVEEVIGTAIFEEPHDSMVMVKDIEVYSLCEHHMLPFFGKAHIAYIPDGRIVGISKFPRIVDVFARRLQLQERLTEEIAQAIEDALRPQGVGVVIEALHLCMMMRDDHERCAGPVQAGPPDARGVPPAGPLARRLVPTGSSATLVSRPGPSRAPERGEVPGSARRSEGRHAEACRGGQRRNGAVRRHLH